MRFANVRKIRQETVARNRQPLLLWMRMQPPSLTAKAVSTRVS